MSYESFKRQFGSLTRASSEQGKNYTKIHLSGDDIYCTRESGSRENIKIRELFEVYNGLDYINTSILRKYISGFKFSPSLAILKAAGFYNDAGYRTSPVKLSEQEIHIKAEAPDELDVEVEERHNDKDEGRFFAALGNMLDSKYLLAKSIGKPVRSDQVVLDSHFEAMGFPDEVNDKVRNVLDILGSDFNMPRNSMVHHIDGMIVNHPILGTRIVEFDEEQHFTPARLVTLNLLNNETYGKLIEFYTAIINNNDYFLNDVLKKHRLSFPESFVVPIWSDMKILIETYGKQNNGYISSKKGFPYLGGRIAQRAYYDLLRDLAHLSILNQDTLKPAIRIPKFLIEIVCKKDFSALSVKEIQESLIYVLKESGFELN